MNIGYDGLMGIFYVNLLCEVFSCVESMIIMGGYNLFFKIIREMIVGFIDVII